jgi:UDP-N-acetylglucosamine 2-epimerase (non-hydrolysing)
MAPIMLECEKRNLQWRWIYTAQHKETMQTTLETFGLPKPDYTIVNWNTEAKTMGKMFKWFFWMLLSLFRPKKILSGNTGKAHILLTHGDTLSTWIGALTARLSRTKVMHVEAGLRSFNIWKPFPEEINRLITFRLSNYYACPGDWAANNLKKYKGIKLNTKMNTQIDTLEFGIKHAEEAKISLPKKSYIVVSIHRYENIFDEKRFLQIIEEIEHISEKYHALIVQHPATKIQLQKLGYKDRLSKNKNIELMPRLEYLQFIKAVQGSEFVVTDGGGNQEELYHMGKPTLLFRNETERREGLGSTAVLSKLDRKTIDDFVKNYKKYKQPKVINKNSPSKLIVDFLVSNNYG